MKKLLCKTWFRRCIQALVVVVSLVVLLIAGVNRWAAGKKYDAVKVMESRGNLVEAAQFEISLPPDSDNFAMIPLMVGLREESSNSPVNPRAGTRADFSDLGRDLTGETFKFPRDGSDLDLAQLAGSLALTGTAAEMLEQFDARHHRALSGIRAGLDLPHAVMPKRIDPTNPRVFLTATSGFLMAFRNAAIGLRVRGELAIAADNGELALESMLMARKLSDLAFSDETWVGKIVAWNVDHSLIRSLKQGMDAGVWDDWEIKTIRDAWSRRDPKGSIARTMNVEGVAMAMLYDHSKRDRALIMEGTPGSDDVARRLKWELIPDAWFDANTAGVLSRTSKWIDLIGSEQPLQAWWDKVAEHERRPRTAWDDLLSGWSGYWDDVVSESILRQGSRAIVEDAMVRLACGIEVYRQVQGSYPSSLEQLGETAIVDPLSGVPFVYRREGEHFILYSIGPDGVDNGGDAKKPHADQADWMWREIW